MIACPGGLVVHKVIKQLGELAPAVLATIGVLSMVFTGLWFLAEPRVREFVSDLAGTHQAAKVCTVFPIAGHYIESAEPGEWATVTWTNIAKVSDCGPPDLVARVVNGDRILHDVPLNVTGIKLPLGVTTELRYKFQVPETATPGAARFYIELAYPEAGRSITSPQIPFTILGRGSHD